MQKEKHAGGRFAQRIWEEGKKITFVTDPREAYPLITKAREGLSLSFTKRWQRKKLESALLFPESHFQPKTQKPIGDDEVTCAVCKI